MTKTVQIGNVSIGGGNPIAVQSMTNVDTKDAAATIQQILDLENAGCEIVRVSVYDEACAQAIKMIRSKIHIPLVADIHFNHRLAIQSIENGIDKVRINPGNIGSDMKVQELVSCAKAHHIPIRIGINSGSLPKDLLLQHGNSVQAMIMGAERHIRLLEKFGFDDIVVSLKSSSVNKTIEACIDFDQQFDYPQHIGTTESGGGRAGYIRSAIAIGSLLHRGIGDTFRVSISNQPIDEIHAAWDILTALDLRKRGIEIISCPTCARHDIDVIAWGEILKERYRHVTQHFKVAVMGCVVNGPGEAAEVDIGIAGGQGYSLIFRDGAIDRKVSNDVALEELMKDIDQMLLLRTQTIQ